MIRVYEDVLPDPLAYREAALAQSFEDVTFGPDTFKGIAPEPNKSVLLAFRRLEPRLKPIVTFLRKSPLGQSEPNFVHNDSDMGKVTGIFYLNPEPAEGDGTSFWKFDLTGESRGPWSKDFHGWTLWNTVEAKFNRLVVFPADLYHSRAIPENYGDGDSARLIQVVFAE